MIYAMLRALAHLVVASQMRLRVAGDEHVPRDGPVLLVSNHLGLTDPLVIAVELSRHVRFLAKAELFEWPVIGGLARGARAIPIRRGASDRQSLRAVAAQLTRGQCVLVFPEGTYSAPPLPAAMIPVKTGAAWLALRTGAPVVPVAIWGTERVWHAARGWRAGRRPEVNVTFGEPYLPARPVGVGMKAACETVADDMARKIAALLPDMYRGHYQEVPSEMAVGV